MSSIPKASEVMEVVEEKSLYSMVKDCDMSELIKVIKLSMLEIEKKIKLSKLSKSSSVKKTGSMPKGVVPKQLRKPRAWVVFVLEYVNRKGWESFVVHHTLKDKSVELIEMVESEEYEGRYIYKGSRTETNQKGKNMIHKDAMSLSKQYWTPKTKTGTQYELYEKFESEYVEEPLLEVLEVLEDDEEVKEVEDVLEAKEDVLEAKEVLEIKKQVVPVVPVVVQVVEEVKVEEVKVVEKKVKLTAKTVVKKVVKWTCENDGVAYPWTYKGKEYLRKFDNSVWLRDGDDAGEWQGVYKVKEDMIDDSEEEPLEYEESA